MSRDISRRHAVHGDGPPLAGGAPKQITDFKSDLIFSFDWSRDRQLACSRGIATGDVFIINNLK